MVVVDFVVVQRVFGDGGAFDGVDGVHDGAVQRRVAAGDAFVHGLREGGDGDELAPPHFRQGAQQSFDFRRQHGGDEALEGARVQGVQRGQRDVYGDAVRRAAGVEVVFEAQFLAVDGEAGRVVGLVNGFVAEEQVGLFHGKRCFAVFFRPLFEGDDAVHVFRQAFHVERRLLALVGKDAAAACFVFALGEGFDERAVLRDDAETGVEFAGDEGVVDEDFVRKRRVVAGVGDVAPGDDGQAVEGGGLAGKDVACFFRPVRVVVLVFGEVGGEVFEFGELDGRAGAGVGALGFDDARCHYCLRRFFGKDGRGEEAEAAVPWAQVVAVLFVPEADLVEEAGEQRAVQGFYLRVFQRESSFGAVRQVVFWRGRVGAVEVQFLFAAVAQ